MNNKITTAVILAAGFGKRMRPITDDIPKPLVEVAKKPMIDWILDALKEIGIKDVIINTHYLADKIAEHLSKRTDLNIRISHEEEILDTGGGVKNMLGMIDDGNIIVVNGDIFWQDVEGEKKALELLIDSWQAEFMDILIMIYDKQKLPSFNKLNGDYKIVDDNGRIEYLSGERYIFAGPRIINKKIFDAIEDRKFSFKKLFDIAEEKKRLYGCVYKGNWYHVGTPEELEYTNNIINKQD